MYKSTTNQSVKADIRERRSTDFTDVAHPDLFHKTLQFEHFLRNLRAQGHEPYRHHVQDYAGGNAVVDGEDRFSKQHVVMMCSADYLGLARRPEVLAGAKNALERFGSSMCSVPLIGGETALHRDLEEALARFIGTEACVLFPTGRAANMGLIQALCGPRDTVICDRFVHCSVLDGIRLSGANRRSFRHSDVQDLVKVLELTRAERPQGGILVVIEGVYGIDGDIAPVNQLLTVCEQYETRVLIDDAHATGVLGGSGRGSPEYHRIHVPWPIIMGSLSKALGSFGGWIATTGEVADYLRYHARSIVFSAGLPAVCAGGGLAALQLLRSHPEFLSRLRANVALFRDGLLELGIGNARKSASAIYSVPVGNESNLQNVACELFRRGVYAEALAYPAVAHGQERIRFRISACHTPDELRYVTEQLKKIFTKLKLTI